MLTATTNTPSCPLIFYVCIHIVSIWNSFIWMSRYRFVLLWIWFQKQNPHINLCRCRIYIKIRRFVQCQHFVIIFINTNQSLTSLSLSIRGEGVVTLWNLPWDRCISTRHMWQKTARITSPGLCEQDSVPGLMIDDRCGQSTLMSVWDGQVLNMPGNVDLTHFGQILFLSCKGIIFKERYFYLR